jgi:2-haloacid dehalogenase
MSELPNSLPPSLRTVRALVFDLFGTCLDWHTPLISTLSSTYPDISSEDWSSFGFAWRTAFLAQTATEGRRGSFRPVAELYSDALDDVIKNAGEIGEVASRWTVEERETMSKAWSQMIPFKDTVPGVDLLRQNLIVYVNILSK